MVLCILLERYKCLSLMIDRIYEFDMRPGVNLTPDRHAEQEASFESENIHRDW